MPRLRSRTNHRAVARIQEVLDRHVLATVHINPESRVKVEHRDSSGPSWSREERACSWSRCSTTRASPRRSRSRARTAGACSSRPAAGRRSRAGEGADRHSGARALGRDVDLHRTADAAAPVRSSARVRDPAGLQPRRRPAVGNDRLQRRPGHPGHRLSQRHRRPVQRACPSHPVASQVLDENGKPATAAFLIQDDLQAHLSERLEAAGARLLLPAAGVPLRRRHDQSARGSFTLTVSRGPEYVPRRCRSSRSWRAAGVAVPAGRAGLIPARYGWYSGDHHIHAAGCSHYENPTEGVLPQDMWPQIDGEALNVASRADVGAVLLLPEAVLLRQDHPLSTPTTPDALRPRGFRLSLEPRRPPRPARAQGSGLSRNEAARGLAHAGRCRSCGGPKRRARSSASRIRAGASRCTARPCRTTRCPAFDGIGANEFIVDVTHPDAVDFISAGDTPYVWELNIWYHIAQCRVPHADQRRDRLSVHHRRPRRAGPVVCEGRRAAHLSQLDRCGARRPQLRVGRQEPPDGLRGQRRAGRVRADSEVKLDAPGTRQGDGHGRGQARPVPGRLDPPRALRREARTGISNARGSATAAKCRSRSSSTERSVATQKLVADGTIRTLTFDIAARAQQLDRRAHPAVLAHQSGVRAGRQASRSAPRGAAPSGA